MIRLGLCCIFKEEEIKFRTTTAKYISSLNDPLPYLSEIILSNTQSLLKALSYCQDNQIGCFRINSHFFPLYTHPTLGFSLEKLPAYDAIISNLQKAKDFAKSNNIRLTFHPDQFVILNSPKNEVIENSIRELLYHDLLANLIGADVINIHGGGVYGDKEKALTTLIQTIEKLPKSLKEKLAIENDDRSYTPNDLIPICLQLKIPFVYDVHHHKCLKDNLTIEEATKLAISTWNREPLFHLSSSLNGYDSKKPGPHHDYIDIKDIPKCWLELKKDITIEVEAKAKELAIKKLQKELIALPTDYETVRIQ